MNRLPRLLLNTATGLSLLLLAATLALWAGDGRAPRDLYSGGTSPQWEYVLSRDASELTLQADRVSEPIPDEHHPPRLRSVIHQYLPGLTIHYRDVGQSWTTGEGVPQDRFWRTARIHVSWWLLLVVWSVLPAWRVLRRRRRILDPTRCSTCGYNLRATPARCPECGTIPAR